MNEKLLYKSNNLVLSENIISTLNSNDINARKHDEKQSQRVGAYGPDEGIAIYVSEEDYERAQQIIAPLLKESEKNVIFCPKCGGEHVTYVTNSLNKYKSGIIILSIIFFLLPICYVIWGLDYDIRSTALDIIAAGMFVISIVLFLMTGKSKNNYSCKDCGKKFHHE